MNKGKFKFKLNSNFYLFYMICLSKAKSKLSQLYIHTDQVQPISGQCFNFSPSEDVRKALEQN